MRRRPGGPGVDLVLAATPGNGARRAAQRSRPVGGAIGRGLRGATLAVLAISAAGCSLSMPMSGLKPDAEPTGSVDRTAAMLSPSLDREDLRRARAAMAVALDPQGNGARSGWQNPQTGARGGFAASAPPFTDHDRVCRRFTGDVAPAGGGGRRLAGSACRDGDGAWHVLSTAGASAAASAGA